jgi:uncharacterized alpha-E superfamily protein
MYVHYILSLDRSVNRENDWKLVLGLYSSYTPDYTASFASDTAEVLKHLLMDNTNFNSLRSMVGKARENA